MASGIAVFVSICLHGSESECFEKALEKKAQQENGCAIDAPEDIAFAATFGRVTSAFAFVRQIHQWIDRANREHQKSMQISVGIECGEYPPPPAKRIEAFERCHELATLANPGQNLIGPAAREMARPLLPGGFMMVELGEIRLGNSMSADKVCQLSISGFPDEFPAIDAFEEVESNVPGLTRDFIGRDEEARQVRKLLTKNQIVTIVGPGGVGKSTLAHWLAYDLAEAYRDGSWKVDLAKIPAGGNVATAIAADLRLPVAADQSAEDRVRNSLATMNGLVWLDNCEHVIQETRTLLPRLLTGCPNVRFLLTSRIRLRLDDEAFIELPTFLVPDQVEDPTDLEAVRLFVSRANSADPDLHFSPADYIPIMEICRRLDGLPLAIELAAAQLRKQSISEVLARLSEAMREAIDGAPARHRTLERALSTSYSLLTEKQKRFFRYLGALAGPTNRDIVIATAALLKASTEESGDILDALVAASLVQESSGKGAHSYRLLEPVRQFAVGHLERQEELQTARAKFAKSILNWLEHLKEAGIAGHRWVYLVDKERANIEAALEIFLQDPKTGKDAMTLCVELYDYWILKGPYDAAHLWYQRAIDAGKKTPAADVGDIYIWMGTLAGYAGRYEDCNVAFERAIEIHAKAGKDDRQATALNNWAIHLRNAGEVDRALDAAQKAVSLSPVDSPALSMRVGNVAAFLIELGRFDEARHYLERAIALNEKYDDPWPRACQHAQLADLALVENKTSEAELHTALCLEAYRECGNIQGFIGTIEFAGLVALRVGEVERAAKLVGGAERQFFSAGVGRPPKDRARRDAALSAIEEAIGKEQAEALYAAGALMSIDDLYGFARASFLV